MRHKLLVKTYLSWLQDDTQELNNLVEFLDNPQDLTLSSSLVTFANLVKRLVEYRATLTLVAAKVSKTLDEVTLQKCDLVNSNIKNITENNKKIKVDELNSIARTDETYIKLKRQISHLREAKNLCYRLHETLKAIETANTEIYRRNNK